MQILQILPGGEEDFATYLRRFQQFLLANGIDDERRRASVFLTVVGKEAYKTLEQLLHPDTPEMKERRTYHDTFNIALISFCLHTAIRPALLQV